MTKLTLLSDGQRIIERDGKTIFAPPVALPCPPNIENRSETDLARVSILEMEFSTTEFSPQIQVR